MLEPPPLPPPPPPPPPALPPPPTPPQNPMVNGSDDLFGLHFPEMLDVQHLLFVYTRK
jgi:hypothetical protein